MHTLTSLHATRRRLRRLAQTLAVALLLPFAGTVASQESYPSKPVRMIVPSAAGGSADIVARLVSDRLGKALGQAIVVDNRAGAGGLIGMEAIARAEPDGYIIGLGTQSTLTVAPIMNKASRVDPLKDFAPISGVASMAGVLTVHPSMPARTFAEFLASAKANPDTYTSGSSGPGSIGQMMIEAMNRDFGIQLRHVPYKGMGPAVVAALSGESKVLFDQYPSSAPHIRSGQMIPVAVGSAERVPNLPQIPTFKELGYPDLNEISITWFGLVAPARTPEALLQKLNAAVAATLADPAIRDRLQELNAVALGTTAPEFDRMIRSSFDRNTRIIQAIGMSSGR